MNEQWNAGCLHNEMDTTIKKGMQNSKIVMHAKDSSFGYQLSSWNISL
jgi:hypothetical protein